MIKDGKKGRPDIYIWYSYSPVYANGEVQENIDILKDEKLIPFTVSVNPFYDEGAALADLILPDATYLERWDWEDMVSPRQIPEYYIRQPLIKPLGEARDFADVCCEMAKKIGFPLGFNSKEEFVKKSCEKTPDVKKAGGFEYMKTKGVLHDPKAKPKYFGYKKVIQDGVTDPNRAAKKIGDDVVYDKETGVLWHWKKSKAKTEKEAGEKGYTHTKNSYQGYAGQKIGDKIYAGFSPDKLNKSGYFELYSILMKEKDFEPLPTYIPIPQHQKMGSDDLILTTYKVAVHIHSRSANSKWLTEMYNDNPALLNPKTAGSLGIKTGDTIKVVSKIGEIKTTARVTEGVIPGVISISHHLGHWEYGRYASNKKAPVKGGKDPDLKHKFWKTHGVHPNWIIPNSPDPVNGQQSWMDTVVQVRKA